MNVALCLSGFPRTMEYSYPYLKKYILDELHPDIFYFGYEDQFTKKEDIINLYKTKSCFARKYTPEVKEEIWSSYGTRKTKNVVHFQGGEALLSQYYNLYNSNKLKSEYEKHKGFTYDIVIRARTDYYFFRKIEKAELSIQPNHVYIPTIWDFGGVSSGFAYGDSSTMNDYSNLFNRLSEYNLIDNHKLHPETIKSYHLKKNNINRVIIKNHFWWELSDFEINGNETSLIDGVRKNPSRRKFQ